MAVTPTGPVSLPIYLLRRMVSLCPTFQTLVGASTAAQAREHIYVKDVEGTERRPCAVISPMGGSYSLIAGGDQNNLRARGTLFLWIAADANEDDANNNVDGFYRFGNIHGGIGSELAGLAGQDQTADTTVTGSHLAITAMRDEGMAESDPELWDSIGRYFAGVWTIEWGDE